MARSTAGRVSPSMASRRDTCRVVKKIARSRTRNMVVKRDEPVSSPSISVCPRCGEPDCQMASLLIGPVTMPATWPSSARRAVTSIAVTAALPASGSMTPQASSRSTTPMSRTSMTPGVPETWDTSVSARTSTSSSQARTARSTTPRSPTATPTASASGGSARVRATISGPTPTGSPTVNARMLRGMGSSRRDGSGWAATGITASLTSGRRCGRATRAGRPRRRRRRR